MTKRPNFLFIMTDQQRADWMSCAGHPVLKTAQHRRDRGGRYPVRKFSCDIACLHAEPGQFS